jgi:hypothetical protein
MPYPEDFIQLQQQEVKSEIEGCKRILEGGAFLYESNRDIAAAIWRVQFFFTFILRKLNHVRMLLRSHSPRCTRESLVQNFLPP